MSSAIADSFFVTGGTLERNAPSYVPRRADDELFRALVDGRFCYVLTPRQMGKSSLMVRTAARLRERGDTAVVLDLTEIGRNLTVDQWYRGLLGSIAESLGLEEEVARYWRSAHDIGPQQRWTKALRDIVVPSVEGRVVLFVDEIDAVRSLPFSTDEFFAGIRELYNRRGESPVASRLTFCLLGVASPSDLIRDTRTTPFNIGQRIELRDFSETEAEPLLEGLGGDTAAARASLRRVLYWTGGQPYLTQRLCKAVSLARPDPDEVDRLAHELFLLPSARERDDNLLFVRDRLLRADADVSALLYLYRSVRARQHVVDDDTNPLISVLKLSGVARVEHGELRVRNRIYEEVFDGDWVVSSLPGAEVRRQVLAFRRGVLRSAAVSAFVLVAVGVLAVYTWTQWRRAEGLAGVADAQREIAEQEQETSRRLLYVAHMSLAFRELEKGNLGRVAEIVAEERPDPSRGDVRGWEYDYLWRLCHGEEARFVHPASVGNCAFTPDGRLVATACDDGVTRLWDATTHEVHGELKSGAGPLTALAVAPDGRSLAVAGAGGAITLWDVDRRETIGVLSGHSGRVYGLAYSPDGRHLASAGNDGMAFLWNVARRAAEWSTPAHAEGATAVAFAPDGATIATAGRDGVVTLWNLAAPDAARASVSLGRGQITDLAFANAGAALAVTTARGSLTLLDLASRRPGRDLYTSEGGLTTVACAPFGERIAVGGFDGTVHVVDMRTGAVGAEVVGNVGPITDLAFSADGRRLVSAGTGGLVKVWPENRLSGTMTTLRGHTETVYSVAFSPDGRRVATGSFDQTVALWDAAAGAKTATLVGHTDDVMTVAFSPDGARLASGSLDQTARLWDVESGREIAVLRGHTNSVFGARFSPRDSILATASFDGTVRIWSSETGAEQRALTASGGSFESLEFSRDGRFLVAGGADHVIVVWDVATWKPVKTIVAANDWINALAISRDGKLLATSGSFGDPVVRIWDTETWTPRTTIKGFFSSDTVEGRIELLGRANSLAFDRGGSTLVVGTDGSTVRLFDMLSGQELGSAATNQQGRICSVAFSADGTILATAADDGTVRLWHAADPRDSGRN
jgi:WD40 repeat protein